MARRGRQAEHLGATEALPSVALPAPGHPQQDPIHGLTGLLSSGGTAGLRRVYFLTYEATASPHPQTAVSSHPHQGRKGCPPPLPADGGLNKSKAKAHGNGMLGRILFIFNV